jgi:hypothetical protein
MPTRFNPPPGWPPAPPGWTPPPGWQPDPSWPAPPPGWPLWVEEADKPSRVKADSWWLIGGGAAIFLGALLPFVSSPVYNYVVIRGGARVTSALFALILAGLGLALRVAFSSRQTATTGRALGMGIPALCLAVLGTLGYLSFAGIGEAGYKQTTALGFSTTVTFSPSIGLILSILGCLAAVVGSIRVIVHRKA